MKSYKIWAILLFSTQIVLSSQTIEEKLASSSDITELSSSGIEQLNQQIAELKCKLKEQCQAAEILHNSGALESEYLALMQSIKETRELIKNLEEKWHSKISPEVAKDEEGYAVWDQEEINLQQLLLEYGPSEFLYIIPPELASLKVYLHSNLPIPKESWKDVLEILIAQNGIGIKTLNPYTKQLYVLKHEPSSVQRIITRKEELHLLSGQTRVFFVFSPPPEQAKSVLQFFEKFADAKLNPVISPIGTKIALVSTKDEVQKLLDLFQAVWQDGKGKVSKVVAVNKMPVKEMEKILLSFFGDAMEKPRGPFTKIDQEGLSVIAPTTGNVLVLVGSEDLVKRAEKMIKDTMDQLQDPTEMTVFLYTCRHSNPEDLAKILEKVYISLLTTGTPNKEVTDMSYSSRGQVIPNPPEGYVPTPPLVVPPQTFKPELSSKVEVDQHGSDHFIPDGKTGNLLMVVRKDALSKIKDILRRLDVPKRMVEIEVLLFEKQLNSQSNFGLNLLKLSNHRDSAHGVRYDGPYPPSPEGLLKPVGNGVLEFLFVGGKSKHFPAYDIAFSFLMTQEDIQLNAAPSIIAVNQTPATISVLEEISINNGAAPVNTSTGQIAYEKAFTRAQYGIEIIMTPIVHIADEMDEIKEGRGSITLLTNITFDTPKSLHDDRPIVDKRHIENEVRVADGQTVILGGLRKKLTQDGKEKIPFLGDIPGIGKLFGSTSLIDKNTEMFIFITPRIIQDPVEEMDQKRQEDLMKRPGDVPEFLQKVIDAREKEKRKYFANSFKVLFSND